MCLCGVEDDGRDSLCGRLEGGVKSRTAESVVDFRVGDVGCLANLIPAKGELRFVRNVHVVREGLRMDVLIM